jgi:hypothetical protein
MAHSSRNITFSTIVFKQMRNTLLEYTAMSESTNGHLATVGDTDDDDRLYGILGITLIQ